MNERENTAVGQQTSSSSLSSEFLASLSDFREDVQSAQEAMLRYEQEHHPLALDEAIAAWEHLCNRPDFLTTPSYFRALALSRGGHSHLYRYYSGREIRDLRRAIELWQAAAKLAPFDPPNLQLATYCYIQLAAGFYEFYNRANEPTDLEQALFAIQKALKITPAASSERPYTFYLTGLLFYGRYLRTGMSTDLEKSLFHYQEAIALTSPDSPQRPLYLAYLGHGLLDRYRRTRAPSDLEKMVHCYQEASTLTPPDSSERAFYMLTLGVGLHTLYKLTQSPTFLEQAMRCYEGVLALPRPNPSDRASVLRALGRGMHDRYLLCTHALDDLNQAISYYREALPQISSDLSRRPGALSTLADGLHDRYLRTRQLADLEQAIAYWEESWDLLKQVFIDLPVAYKLGQQRRYSDLPEHLIFAHIELALICHTKSLASRRRALEVAEGSKSHLLTELTGRGSISAPATISPETATRERDLLAKLTALDTADLATYDSLDPIEGMTTMPLLPGVLSKQTERERVSLRQQYLGELEHIWEAIAHLGSEEAEYVALRCGEMLNWAGFKRFASDLGPQTALLSFSLIPAGTLLFLLRAGWRVPRIGISAELNQEQWRNILERFFREIPGSAGSNRRGETWDQPLRAFLREATSDLEGVERLIFAPMGSSHVLPWSVLTQRVGWRSPDGTLLPVVTLPALGILPRLRQRPHLVNKQALVIGNPQGNLPFAETEAREVAARLKVSPLLGVQATRAVVLAHLSDANIIHIAAHASFIPGAPQEASIELADGPLTAREIVTQRLHANLLVLSACQTGRSETFGGEELAGLAQSFLHAGVRSLIVSLWKVSDPATATFMRAFYDAYGSGSDKARALQIAMRAVQQEPRWHHPYYWGAFVLIGDWQE